jgi:hypothetical protein
MWNLSHLSRHGLDHEHSRPIQSICGAEWSPPPPLVYGSRRWIQAPRAPGSMIGRILGSVNGLPSESSAGCDTCKPIRDLIDMRSFRSSHSPPFTVYASPSAEPHQSGPLEARIVQSREKFWLIPGEGISSRTKLAYAVIGAWQSGNYSSDACLAGPPQLVPP